METKGKQNWECHSGGYGAQPESICYWSAWWQEHEEQFNHYNVKMDQIADERIEEIDRRGRPNQHSC